MKTHNAFMYHCLNCGNVIHSERKPCPPRCCDYEMVLAAAETIYDHEEAVPEPTAENHWEIAAPGQDLR